MSCGFNISHPYFKENIFTSVYIVGKKFILKYKKALLDERL